MAVEKSREPTFLLERDDVSEPPLCFLEVFLVFWVEQCKALETEMVQQHHWVLKHVEQRQMELE